MNRGVSRFLSPVVVERATALADLLGMLEQSARREAGTRTTDDENELFIFAEDLAEMVGHLRAAAGPPIRRDDNLPVRRILNAALEHFRELDRGGAS